MNTPGHNKKTVLVELEPDSVEYLLESCENEMVYGLNALAILRNKDKAQQVVNNIEAAKKIKAALEQAKAKS